MARRAELLAIAGILVLALGLRVTGIRFGLDLDDPETSNLATLTDERGMVDVVQDNFLHGKLDPGSFLNRGPAVFLLFGTVDAALIGLHAVTHPGGWQGRMGELAANPSWLHFVHRLVSALGGTLGVFLLWRIVRREFDPASGLCAALLLAVAYLHVRESHFGMTDVLWSTTVLLALDRMFLWIRDPGAAQAVASGLLVGLSIATKYFSGLLGLGLALAWFFGRRSAPAGTVKPRTLVLAWLAAPLGFALASPGLFLHAQDFLHRLDFNSEKYFNAGTSTSLLGNAQLHGTYSLGIGLGEPVIGLALLGLVLLWRRCGARGRFYVLTLLLVLPSLFLTSFRPVRYAVPVLVLLAGSAGVALAALLAHLKPAVRWGAVALCVTPSLARALSFDVLLSQRDTRNEMLAELERRGVPANEVLAIGSHHGLPHGAQRNSRDFVVYGPTVPGRPGLTLAAVRAHPPRLVLRELTAPEWAVPERADLEEFLRADYREVMHLDGRRVESALPDDVSGAVSLMVPYASPWELRRPGPPLVLYERVADAAATEPAPAQR